MSNKDFNLKASSPSVHELCKQLPRVAEMLNIKIEDMHILENAMRRHMHGNKRDRLIKWEGLVKGMPPIRYRAGMQSSSFVTHPCVGLSLYETQTDEQLKKPIKYVVFAAGDGPGEENEHFIICEKGKLFRLERYWRRLRNQREFDPTPPILEPGFLDDILNSSVGFLLRANEIEKYNVSLRRGIVLSGDPGNGKTMTCRWICELCDEYDISYNSVNGAHIEHAYKKGELDELMASATVMFFDDIDVSFFNRDSSRTTGDGKMCCAMLSAMDGMMQEGHCIRIFTTNERIEDMDRAFKRPGRIDRVFEFKVPSLGLRKQLVDTWHPEILAEIDASEVARRTEGYSFAEVNAIKDMLVTNKLFGDETWNLDRAMELFEEGKVLKKEVAEAKIETDEVAEVGCSPAPIRTANGWKC